MLQALHTESQATPMLPCITPPIVEEEVEEYSSEESLSESKESEGKSSTQKIFKPREQLMLRANSLKKAVRQIIEQAEKGASARLCLLITWGIFFLP